MSEKVKLEQVFAWAKAGDLASLSTKVPEAMLSKGDATGQRAMHVAASAGQTAVVEWLVENEARDTGVNKPDEDARGPLHLAAWYGRADTVRALLEMGAIRDRPTRTGFTPLHYACFSGNLATVKVLVEFGAKIDAKDESQQTPGDVARRFNHDQVAEYMEKEAPVITVEARKRYAYMGEASEATAQVSDPIIEAIQSNEEANLERILKTASKVVAEKPLVGASSESGAASSGSDMPKGRPRRPQEQAESSSSISIDKQLLVGAGVFLLTLALGMALGRLSALQQARSSRDT